MNRKSGAFFREQVFIGTQRRAAFRLPPYRIEYTRTRRISQVKQCRARLVLESETA